MVAGRGILSSAMKGDMASDERKRCCLERSWSFVPFSGGVSSNVGWQYGHVGLDSVSIFV